MSRISRGHTGCHYYELEGGPYASPSCDRGLQVSLLINNFLHSIPQKQMSLNLDGKWMNKDQERDSLLKVVDYGGFGR
jgi:hypothetical protein